MSIADTAHWVANSLNSPFEILVMIVIAGTGLAFYDEDFRIGIILHMVMFSVIFVWFYIQDLQWWMPLTGMLLALVVLTFTLYKTPDAGGIGGIA